MRRMKIYNHVLIVHAPGGPKDAVHLRRVDTETRKPNKHNRRRESDKVGTNGSRKTARIVACVCIE